MFLDYSCSAPKQAVGLTYPEPDFSPEVQSLSVPLYGEQFRQFPINAEIMSLLESCHLMPVEVKVIYFMVGGALSALAGVLITSRMGTAQPTLGTNWPMETIAGIVIGGTHFQGGSGSIVNSVLGVLLMTMITNGLNLLGVNTFWQSVVTALLLIITIVISTFQDRKKSLL